MKIFTNCEKYIIIYISKYYAGQIWGKYMKSKTYFFYFLIRIFPSQKYTKTYYIQTLNSLVLNVTDKI